MRNCIHTRDYRALGFISPVHYERDRMFCNAGSSTAANRRSLLTPTRIAVVVNDVLYVQNGALTIDLNTSTYWDTLVPTDYTSAANRAGKDFYIYACQPSAGTVPVIKLSDATTYPSGYTATNSRKIGGFHCECADVGTISGHPLTGYLAGDILPRSCWDLKHRSHGSQVGVVWAGKTDFDSLNYVPIWVAIYLASGTGTNTTSVYGGTISDTRDWNSFVDDFAAIGCRMPTDEEFQALAAGSNEETAISGSADPVTTGGHVDTAGRRMISNIGCEDCCGAMWHWLRTQSYRFDGAANHTHQVTVSGDPQTVTSANPSGDVAPAFDWYDLPGAKGSLYRQGTYGDAKLLAGGCWDDGSTCGSRSRLANYSRWAAYSYIGGRFLADPA